MSQPAQDCRRAGRWSLAAAWREAVFPPKNETEQRKPATLTDKGKEKQKAELSCCPSRSMVGELRLWEHIGLGQWARAAWSCGAVGLGGCHHLQHSTAALRKEKRDLAIYSGLWETPRSYPALAPSLGAQSAPFQLWGPAQQHPQSLTRSRIVLARCPGLT